MPCEASRPARRAGRWPFGVLGYSVEAVTAEKDNFNEGNRDRRCGLSVDKRGSCSSGSWAAATAAAKSTYRHPSSEFGFVVPNSAEGLLHFRRSCLLAGFVSLRRRRYCQQVQYRWVVEC